MRPQRATYLLNGRCRDILFPALRLYCHTNSYCVAYNQCASDVNAAIARDRGLLDILKTHRREEHAYEILKFSWGGGSRSIKKRLPYFAILIFDESCDLYGEPSGQSNHAATVLDEAGRFTTGLMTTDLCNY